MFLREARFVNLPEPSAYPFNLPAFEGVQTIAFDRFLTILVGENGSGKSTLLEAIAVAAGFNAEGGSRSNRFATVSEDFVLSNHLQLSWMPKVTNGFFFRAESFFNFSTYIDEIAKAEDEPYRSYGGRPLHEQSHGESFLNLFSYRLNNRSRALYLLDEPEAALSPARQLAFLRVLHDHERGQRSQFIVATHSPIVLGYPGANLLNFDERPIQPVTYKETSHYLITRQFLTAPEPLLRELFADD